MRADGPASGRRPADRGEGRLGFRFAHTGDADQVDGLGGGREKEVSRHVRVSSDPVGSYVTR